MIDKTIDNLEAKHHRLMQEGRTYEAAQVEAQVMALLDPNPPEDQDPADLYWQD